MDHGPAAPRSSPDWRDPTMWLIVGLPLAAVVGGLFTLWLAIHYRDPLVSDAATKAGVTAQEPAPPQPHGPGG